jgi:uncharacterized Zn-finger protein
MTMPQTQAPEVISVPADSDQVKCDGGGGPLGHPTVYYSFDGKQQVECLYCDRVFVKNA